MKNTLKNIFFIGALATASVLYPIKSYADDIMKGMRGPTLVQIEERATYSKNKKDIETLTDNLILKYWDGDNFGKWAFVNLPYKNIKSSNGTGEGLGDITMGLGPRLSINNIHLLPYGGAVFPTAAKKDNMNFGNQRTDYKISTLATYLSDEKKFELDGVAEYTFTGKNDLEVNPPDELYLAMFIGTGLTEKLRFAAGPTFLRKDNGDYLLNGRAVLRYTPSKKWNLQAIIDKSLESKTLIESESMGLALRLNF